MEVISIEKVGYEEVVYDLETEIGTFLAGGIKEGIIVKNTDSCYVKFPIHRSDYLTEEDFMKANFIMAEECAKYCTSHFKPPSELIFEKFMYPFIIFAKKRYSYIEWTNYTGPTPGINYKGLQLVRRDTCRYVKEELNNIFEIIMKQKSSETVKDNIVPYIKTSIQNLIDGNIDYNKLILSKQLKAKYVVRKKNISQTYHWTDNRIQQPHVRLAQELKVINPANHPKPPDRVPYLFIEKKGATLQCDKVIHPLNFDPKIHKIDSLYYFEKQYLKPINMICQFFVLGKKGQPEPEKIYKGIIISKKNQINGQPEIMNFMKKEINNQIKEFKFNPDFIVEVDDDGSENDSEE